MCFPITCQCTPQSHVCPALHSVCLLAQMKWLRHDSDSGFGMPHSHLICMPTRGERERDGDGEGRLLLVLFDAVLLRAAICVLRFSLSSQSYELRGVCEIFHIFYVPKNQMGKVCARWFVWEMVCALDVCVPQPALGPWQQL